MSISLPRAAGNAPQNGDEFEDSISMRVMAFPCSVLPESADPVLRLKAHYFGPCEVSFKQQQKLDAEFQKKGQLSFRKKCDLRDFTYLWLATLYVSYDGLKTKEVQHELSRWEPINSFIQNRLLSIKEIEKNQDYISALRRFRNATFHYQDSAVKHIEFILSSGDEGPFEWARSLYWAISLLLNSYSFQHRIGFNYQQLRCRGHTSGN